MYIISKRPIFAIPLVTAAMLVLGGFNPAAKADSPSDVVALSCPSGYVFSGAKCVRDLAPAPMCPAGYVFSSGQCERGAAPVAAAPSPEAVTLSPNVWPVGKWPEGLAYDGDSLWVAESGQRQIAELNPDDGHVVRRVPVGRLPVQMAPGADSQIFALVVTDQLVWMQRALGHGSIAARLKEYPDDMVGDGRVLRILTRINGSNESARVVRLDPRNGAQISSDVLGRAASGLAIAEGGVRVVHGYKQAGHISVLDQETLENRRQFDLDVFVTKIAAHAGAVFLAGGEWDKTGVVVRIDAATGQKTARRDLPGQFIYALAAENGHVVAIGHQGRIWILSQRDLSIERVIGLSIGQFEPHAILPLADKLYFTAFHDSDNTQFGSVLGVDRWKP